MLTFLFCVCSIWVLMTWNRQHIHLFGGCCMWELVYPTWFILLLYLPLTISSSTITYHEISSISSLYVNDKHTIIVSLLLCCLVIVFWVYCISSFVWHLLFSCVFFCFILYLYNSGYYGQWLGCLWGNIVFQIWKEKLIVKSELWRRLKSLGQKELISRYLFAIQAFDITLGSLWSIILLKNI